MANHAQALMLSTHVHSVFGDTLMSAALARIVEICFVAPSYSPLADGDGGSEHTLADENVPHEGKTRSWRHLPPFVSDNRF
jgi:hypothetical protein